MFSKEFLIKFLVVVGRFQRNHDRPWPTHSTLQTPELYMYRGISFKYIKREESKVQTPSRMIVGGVAVVVVVTMKG